MRKPISLLLALLGLFDSLYLLWVYTSPSRPMICFGTGGGCDAVRASVYAHLRGIPMPAFGVAGYILIGLLIIAESIAPLPLAAEVRYALAGVTTLGFLYSLYLEYLQGFVIHAFCAWCVTSGVVMTALCGLAIFNVIRPAPASDPRAQLAQVRTYFVLSVFALLIGVPAFYQLSAHGETPPPPPPPATESTADKLVRPDSHVFGNPNAALTVVEFGDFECPACGREEPVAKEIRAKYASQIRFVFRQFPLIHTHKFSERMAEASECAAEQGKFWEAVDQIYSHQEEATEEGLKGDAAAIGLDLNRFNGCMATGAEAARVKRDMEDARALGVDSTPTIFVGTHAVADVPDFDEFSRLINQELAAKGAASPSPTAASAPSAPVAGPAEPKKPSASASENAAPHQAAASTTSAPLGVFGAAPGGAFSNFQSSEVTCSENEAAKKQPALIDTSQLRAVLPAKPLFVDVRPAKEYAAGHIAGALNIPVDDMPRRWDSLPKDRIIVFYESGKSSVDICAAGRAAGRVLLENGYPFDQVKVYQDGLAGWQKAGLSPTQ